MKQYLSPKWLFTGTLVLIVHGLVVKMKNLNLKDVALYLKMKEIQVLKKPNGITIIYEFYLSI